MSAAQFRLIDLLLAITVHLPVRHSHGTRTRFTVLVSCSADCWACSSFMSAPLYCRHRRSHGGLGGHVPTDC